MNFRKVDQRGGTNYPSADSGWAEEISLDPDIKVDTMKINAPKPKPIVEHVPVSVPVAAGCPAGTYDGGSRCIPVPHARSAADLANDPWIEDQIAAQSGHPGSVTGTDSAGHSYGVGCSNNQSSPLPGCDDSPSYNPDGTRQMP